MTLFHLIIIILGVVLNVKAYLDRKKYNTLNSFITLGAAVFDLILSIVALIILYNLTNQIIIFNI